MLFGGVKSSLMSCPLRFVNFRVQVLPRATKVSKTRLVPNILRYFGSFTSLKGLRSLRFYLGAARTGSHSPEPELLNLKT